MKKRYLILGLSTLLLASCGGQTSEDKSSNSGSEMLTTETTGTSETTETTTTESTESTDTGTSEEIKNFEGLVFDDAVVTYDGNPHTISVGNLPDGANVEYEGEHEFINVGVYQIKAKVSKEGYNDANLDAKLKIQPQEATEARMIDDFEGVGDNDLASDWTLEYYSSSGWTVPSSASIKVAYNQVFGTGESTMRLNMTHQGSPFKVTKEVTPDRIGYTGFALDVFDDPNIAGASTKVQFQMWFKDLPLPEAYSGYKDTYITYTLDTAVNSNWTHYEIPFTDSSISIASGAIQPSMLEDMGVSVKDLMFYLDKVAVLVTPNYIDNGPKAYSYIDNIQLLNVTEKKVETRVDLAGKSYTALSSNGSVVGLDFTSATAATISVKNLETPVQLPCTYTVTGDSVAVTASLAANISLQVNLKAKNNGAYLAIDGNPTGTQEALSAFAPYAEHFQFEKLDQAIIADDFESYEATGTGLDRVNREIANVTGLRAAYYGEVYNESKPAPGIIGDQNWSLMNAGASGWENYIALENDGHAGKAMGLKNNSDWQLRYMSMGLATGKAQPIGRGEYLSLFVKGNAAQAMKVKAYYENRITTANQAVESGSCTSVAAIPVTTEWTQVLIKLEANREVYGIDIIPTKANGRIYVDDVYLMGEGNYFAKYEAPISYTVSDGSYYLWNGAEEVFTIDIADSVSTATIDKLGVSLNYPANVTMSNNKLTIQVATALTVEANILEGEKFKVTAVSGEAASMFSSSLMNKTFKKYAEIDNDFQGSEYVVDNEVPSAGWTKEKYDSSWVSGGKMYVKKSNSTNKFINFKCGYGYSYRYTYTPSLPIGPVNTVSFDYANDWGEADIKVKVSIIDMGDNATYLVGDASNWVTIPNGAGDRMNDGMLHMDIPLTTVKNVKSFRITVNTPKNGDNYLYVDNLFLGYK